MPLTTPPVTGVRLPTLTGQPGAMRDTQPSANGVSPGKTGVPGCGILAVPLVPSEGQMIGLVLLYRKGEQPFMESDVALAEMISLATAMAVQRND